MNLEGSGGVVLAHPVQWTGDAQADNALATATKAAQVDKTHYLCAVIAGYSNANAGKLVTVKDGATIVLRARIHNSLELVFANPLRITRGNAVSAELDASGTAGQNGNVAILGFTR